MLKNNHKRRAAPAHLAIRCPRGWRATPPSIDLEVPNRSTASTEVSIRVPKNAAQRQHAVTADVTFGGVYYGEAFDCLVKVD
ncbi:hypothetical protein H8D79_00900 [PVC group bacterium]|nr:hypothetical protein [PVC group bacterium]